MLVNEKHREELRLNGYTVIENVVTEKQCDIWMAEYKKWLSQFKDSEWPFTAHSLVQRYNTGNMETTWEARIATKRVFDELWKTEKLFTSVDAIAIGRPPESSDEEFALPGQHWLHIDQDSERKGLHAYQGGLYLEHVDEDDWTFHSIKCSHLYTEEFYENNQKAAVRSSMNKFYHLNDDDIKFFESKGCETCRISVPKGGMLLWDSRLIHANARPIKGRKHPNRWRFVVLSCMAPAIWATEEDIEKKRTAYKSVAMTTHWPCQGVNFMKTDIPSYSPKGTNMTTKKGTTLRSKKAKQLCGVIPYDFKDGKSNGPEWFPKWIKATTSVGSNWKGRWQKDVFNFILGFVFMYVVLIAYKWAR